MKITKQMQVDDLGRVVIPVDIRNNFGIEKKDKLEVYAEGQKIVFQKPSKNCVICGKNKNLHDYKGQLFCENCVRKLSQQIVEEIIKDNSKNKQLDYINNKINIKREELDTAIKEKQDYNCIYTISVELDQLIAEFYKYSEKTK